MTVNGKRYEGLVEPRLSLADFLRDQLGLDRNPSRLRTRNMRQLHGSV